jgi:membrane associated rhomboid family serine protease
VIPLRDANPTRRLPVVTLSLIALCCAAFAWELVVLAQGGDPGLGDFLTVHGVVPGDLTSSLRSGEWLSLPVIGILTSLFLHADWFHLLGNMLYLWIFGNNVEDWMGRPVFLAFYLVGGVAAVAGQVAVDPSSELVMIGASGAISAVLGAYLVLFPGARIQSLVYLGVIYTLIALPAVLVLGFWFALNLLDALGWMGAVGDTGVAFFAHVTGFMAGVLLALPFRIKRQPAPALAA